MKDLPSFLMPHITQYQQDMVRQGFAVENVHGITCSGITMLMAGYIKTLSDNYGTPIADLEAICVKELHDNLSAMGCSVVKH